MDLKDKIVSALSIALPVDFIRLEEDDGISGFVVSSKFNGMSSLDRQTVIEDALASSAEPLTAEEHRQVLMIAGLTPVEYESVGARIRVHRIRDLGGGQIEVLIHGGFSDAKYVQGALEHEKGVHCTEPERPAGATGILTSFRAEGSDSNALTKEKAISLLSGDPYIAVMPGV